MLTALRLELLSKFLLSRLFSAFLSRSMSFRRVEVGLGLDEPSSGTGDEGPVDVEEGLRLRGDVRLAIAMASCRLMRDTKNVNF